MKKSIKTIFTRLLLVSIIALGVTASIIVPTNVSATATNCNTYTKGSMRRSACEASSSDQAGCLFGSGCALTNIINAILYVVGALAVVMIIFGGILYTLSSGDGTKVTNAKNTIMYAIVGLVVAILAFAIVNWVLGELIK